MSAPKLLLPDEYVPTATKHINQAKESISLVSMIVTDDHRTDVLIDALASAAKRGVRVEVAADIFTFGEFGGHLKPLKYYSEKSRQTAHMAKELRENGVKFTWVGRFSASPFSGRNHMKCLVIDDTVYSFGGINMDDASLDHTDYMFEVTDRQLAMELRDDIGRIIEADSKNFAYRSHEFSFGKKSIVLIDGGLQTDSIIYRRACRLAKDAKEILFVSQYCPTGRLSRLMKRTKSKLYFNNPKRTNNRINAALIRFNMLVSGNKTRYRRTPYLHSKFMIFTMHDGRKIALTGSHNFTYIGVLFGTREIALQTEDPKIIKQLEKFYTEHVK
jgi:cardiolipin synthase